MRGKKVYEPPQFMSVNTAIDQILEVIKDKDDCDRDLLSEDTLCVGIARLGTEGQIIKSGGILDYFMIIIFLVGLFKWSVRAIKPLFNR